MLNSAEHAIYPAHNVKKIAGILTFISMINTASERLKGIIPIRINHFSSHRNRSKFSKTSRIKVKDDLNFYRQAQIS